MRLLLLASLLPACGPAVISFPGDEKTDGSDLDTALDDTAAGDSGDTDTGATGDSGDSGDSGDPVGIPDIDVDPAALDFGLVGQGSPVALVVAIRNAGDAELDATLDVAEPAFAVDFPTVRVPAGGESLVTVTFQADQVDTYVGELAILSNDPDEPAVAVGLVGVVGSPAEIDHDGDGYMADVDCDDDDALTYPGADEVWYDGVDEACDGGSDFDADADGHDAAAYGGDDCDDADATVVPGAAETWYDGIDQDCSGTSDFDADADGHDAADHGGDDCDDTDAAVSPSAPETWYDGVDGDCAGGDDFDQDGDGSTSAIFGGDDCDDLDAALHPGAADAWYDGVDADCDGASDYDQDGDGADASTYGGTDCADTDAAISPSAVETCDGVDQDCDGTADDGAGSAWYADADGDGYGDAAAATTACSAPSGYVADATDCDDGDVASFPGAPEVAYDRADNDCDGIPDQMVAEDESGWTVIGERTSDAAGAGGVYTLDDMDGDGNGELIVCAAAANTSSYTDIGIVAFHDTPGTGTALSGGYLEVYGNSSDDFLGSAFVELGDLEGGGAVELAVGAYQNDANATDDGTVYVKDVYASSGSVVASWYAEGAIYGLDNSGWFGYALAAGDFDGDGTNDLATGAPGEDSGKGKVYVTFYDDGLGWDDIDADDSSFWVKGVSGSDHLGYSVAFGDFGGDGYDDLVACSPDDDDGGSGSGTCWLVNGASSRSGGGVQGSTVNSVDNAVITGGAASDQLGLTNQSLAVGDLDDDGRDDLAVGMPGYDGYVAGGGAILVYQGGSLSGSETSATASWLVRGDGALGTAVAAGDVTGDGVDDLLGGAVTAGAAGQGVVYLFAGDQPTGTYTLPTDQYASWTGADAGDAFGTSIGGLFDLDGDGTLDFAAAAPGSDDGATDGGKVYVLPAYP